MQCSLQLNCNSTVNSTWYFTLFPFKNHVISVLFNGLIEYEYHYAAEAVPHV